MNSKTKSTFEAADVILEEVRVFVKIDCFKGEFAKTFATVCICSGLRGDATTTEFRTCSILSNISDRSTYIRSLTSTYLVVHGWFWITEMILA